MTKDFLITLENGKELLAQSDIDGQDIEDEKVNKIAKKTEKKTTGRDTIGDKFFRRLSSDYYFSETKQKKAKEIGKGIFLDQGGTLWECRFRKNKRWIKRIFMLYSSFKSDQNNCEINSQVPGVQVEMQKMQKMSTTGWWGLFS